MDVTARRQPAASAPAVSVRQAPDERPSAPSASSAPAPAANHVHGEQPAMQFRSEPAPPQPAAENTTPESIREEISKQQAADPVMQARPNNHQSVPIAAVTGAICMMIGLSAVAILVYLQSQ